MPEEEKNQPGLEARLWEFQKARRTAAIAFLEAHEGIELLLTGPPRLLVPAEDLEETKARIQSLLTHMTNSGEVSALDTFARLDPNTPDHGWLDAGQYPTMPKLDGFVITGEGPYPGLGRMVTFIELGANGIASSHVTAIGAEVARRGGTTDESIYVRFKGGALYRYSPFTDGISRWADMVTICRQMKQALPVSLTIGEYVERVLKTAHENDIVSCDKLEDGKWAEAAKPSEVAAQRAARKREKAAGTQDGPPGGVPF